MIPIAGMICVLFEEIRRASAVTTISLSATGSISVPSLVVTFHLRATYPSNKSVKAAATNMVQVKKQYTKYATHYAKQ